MFLALNFKEYQHHQHQPEDREPFHRNPIFLQDQMEFLSNLRYWLYLMYLEEKKICSSSQSMNQQNKHHKRRRNLRRSLLKTLRQSDQTTTFDEFYNVFQFWSRKVMGITRKQRDFYLAYTRDCGTLRHLTSRAFFAAAA